MVAGSILVLKLAPVPPVETGMKGAQTAAAPRSMGGSAALRVSSVSRTAPGSHSAALRELAAYSRHSASPGGQRERAAA